MGKRRTCFESVHMWKHNRVGKCDYKSCHDGNARWKFFSSAPGPSTKYNLKPFVSHSQYYTLPGTRYFVVNNIVRPVTMETRCFHEELEFQRYLPKYFCTARYEHKSSKKKFQTFQNNNSWTDLGPRSA